MRLKSKSSFKSILTMQAVLALCANSAPVFAQRLVGQDSDKAMNEAAATLQGGKSRAPISALAASGWAKYTKGDRDGAWKDFNKAIAQNPQDIDALTGRASIYCDHGLYNPAVIDANKAVLFDADNVQARYMHGLICIRINRFADARDDLKFVVQMSPNSAVGHRVLADAYRNSGDRKNAFSEYKAASKLYAANPDRVREMEYYAHIVDPSNTSSRDLSKDLPLSAGENLAKVYSAFPDEEKDKSGRTIFQRTLKWTNGKTITVAFNGGEPALRDLIARTAVEWSKYGNIKFDFIDPSTGKFREWSANDTRYSADIRIAFEPEGYWSVIGTQSNTLIPANRQSMNLDPANWQDLRGFYTGTILHEFGHALGFLHEHQHPNSGGMTEIRWQDDPGYVPTKDNSGVYMADAQGRLPGLLSYYVSTQHWSPYMTYSQIANYEDSDALTLGSVDTTSIMQYEQEPFLLRTGMASPCFAHSNNVLSEQDKISIQKQYPGLTGGTRSDSTSAASALPGAPSVSPGTVRGADMAVPELRGGRTDSPHPGSSDLTMKGFELYKAHNYAAAINYFTQAINADPQNIHAIMLRAYSRQASGDLINALSDFNLSHIAPMQPECLSESGICYVGLSNYSSAVDAFNKAIAAEPRGPFASYAYAGRAAAKRGLHDTAGALADCDAALKLNPRDFNALWQRAVTYFSAQQYPNAAADLKALLEKQPGFADGHLMLAQCYQKMNMRKDAITEYQKANYLYEQAHDADGIEQVTTALKILQANNHSNSVSDKSHT